MSVQVIIAFYAIICTMMIIFNLSYLQVEYVRTWYLKRQTMYISYELQQEIRKNLDFPTDEHRAMLYKRLKRLPGMESFDLTMERLSEDAPAAAEHYLNGITTVFEELIPSFSSRDQLRRAYFAAITKRWYRKRPCNPVMMESFIQALTSRALYTRQNAFEAIVEIGSPEEIAHAIHVIDDTKSEHSSRLVSETLLMFPQNHDDLADALLRELGSYSVNMRSCIINFLRLSDSGREGSAGAPEDRYRFIKNVMDDEEEELDVRLACARYFMHNPWNPALATLLRFARLDSSALWEYAAVAALVLSSYPCQKTVRALKSCLRSPVYHVRFNAAQSLYKLGLDLETDLADIMYGDDAYAREMLQYRWEIERKREEYRLRKHNTQGEPSTGINDGDDDLEMAGGAA